MEKAINIAMMIGMIFCVSCTNSKDTTLPSQPSTSTNQAPASPFQPFPADGSTGIVCPKTFSWQCYDPDLGDTLYYQIVMGVGNYTDTFQLSRGTSFIVNQLSPSSDYIWRVDATDNHGAKTIGTVWHFRAY